MSSQTDDDQERRIREHFQTGLNDLLSLCNAHHHKQMKGRAGGAAICICGVGCGGTLACSTLKTLIWKAEMYDAQNDKRKKG